MQYVLIDGQQLILGPMNWNFRMFESSLRDDLDVVEQLPANKSDANPIELTSNIRILPVDMLPNPEFNSKTQGLHGPFFSYSSTMATGHYEVMDLPVEAVRNFMLATVATNRYAKEVSGIQLVIRGIELSVTTARVERDIYAQALLLGSNGANWKFPNGVWITLSTAELQTLVQAIMAHVQATFTWESTKVAELHSKITLAELAAVNLED